MTERTYWRSEAEEWVELSDDGAALHAIAYALLDLTDAIRSQAPQLVSLRELLDAAPTAEALTLLMRAVQHDQTTNEGSDR